MGRASCASLFADGSPAALSAAAMIQKGVDRDLYAVALSAEERDAILAVLEDPPEALADLRGCWRGISAIGCSRESSGEHPRPGPALVAGVAAPWSRRA